MKLGKGPARKDNRTLRLASYLGSLPEPLLEISWTHGIVDFGMLGNDHLGDCTAAGIGHAEQTVTANTTVEAVISDQIVIALYEASCGYVSGDPATDQGGIELDVLNYVRKNGFAGDQLLAYADPDPGDIRHVKQAISLFGGVYIGLQLPLSAQGQDEWDVIGDPSKNAGSQAGSWGGHAVWVPAYNPVGPVCVTWGALKQMTWKFWETYCDESHALLFLNWLLEFGGDAAINLPALMDDLAIVTK